MASMPGGITHFQPCMFHRLIGQENKVYHYLRWSSKFNNYSLNWIFSLNPKRNQYICIKNILPKSIAGFGANIQFMFIYHH